MGAGRLAALSGERVTCLKEDFELVMAHKQLDKMKGMPDLVQAIMETTVLDNAVRRGWKDIGEELCKIYSRGEMYDPDFQLALKNLVYLAMPDDVKKSYRAKYAPKKKGEVESRAVVALKKLKHAAQKRVSDTVAAIVKAAYPPMSVPKLPSEKEDEEKEAEAELKSLASGGGEREEERSRSTETGCSAYTDDSAMDGEEDEDDDYAATGGIVPRKAAGGAGGGKPRSDSDALEAAAESDAKRFAAEHARGKSVNFWTVNAVFEKTSLLRKAASDLYGHLHSSSTMITLADGITAMALPLPSFEGTGKFLLTIGATFNEDGTLSKATDESVKGTLPSSATAAAPKVAFSS